jgi:hypothetical protein
MLVALAAGLWLIREMGGGERCLIESTAPRG